MSRNALKVSAVVLGLAIVGVLFAGLDDLPRGLRREIVQERRALAESRAKLEAGRQDVARKVAAEPVLFRADGTDTALTRRLEAAGAMLAAVSGEMTRLEALEKANRRVDAERARALLGQERRQRAAAEAAAEAVKQETARRSEIPRRLPEQVAAMERDYQAARGVDLAPVAAAVARAGGDWPAKRADLESRLAGLRALAAESERTWESSAEARRRAAASDAAHVDYAALLGAAGAVKSAATDLPKRGEELKALAGQLYTGWDKVLVDMEERGTGKAREYNQKIRTVRTRIEDVESKKSAITSEEQWTDVSRETYLARRDHLGMVIEHKSPGRYDSETESVAQPAGFAYVAPPSVRSNQYGYWDRRDGRDFWVFYGQYALLRDLLFNRGYQPMPRYEYEQYRGYAQRGQTYYGRDTSAGTAAPKYGSQGTATQERYSGSTYARGGGFKDSSYASRSGGYRGSQYSTPAARSPGGDTSPRTFGRSAPDRPSAPAARAPAPRAPERNYRPPPRPMPRPSAPSRPPARSFGRRR